MNHETSITFERKFQKLTLSNKENNNFHVESVKVIFLTKLLAKTKNRVKKRVLRHVIIYI